MNEHPDYGRLRPVTPDASVLVAPNPSVMTLEGTNSWVVRAPGARDCVVIDPGPKDPDHLRALAGHGPVSLILLTHHHVDHTEGVPEFVALTGAPVRARDPELCRAADAVHEGELVECAGVRLRVLETPGHTGDSVCFRSEGAAPALLSGDTVLGRGTTVVAHPDGHLGSYLDSMARLAKLPESTTVLPGHGPELPDVVSVAADYLTHREQRLDQVRAVIRDQGPAVTARQVVETVYADVDPSLWTPAEWSVQAQLTYLAERGEL